MKNNQFRFFSGKIVTFLAGNFTMEKALFKNIFLHNFFICQSIFKMFVALFKTFGMQNGDMLIFFSRSFRKVRLGKMQFLEDGVKTVHQENMSVQYIPPQTPLLYSKTGVCRGIPIFLIFAPKHRLWVLIRTASARRF